MEVTPSGLEESESVAPLITEFRRAVLGPEEPRCTPEEAAAWIRERAQRRPVVLIAREGGEAVGVARMVLRTDKAVPGFVPELYVRPAARRRGAGTALVRELVAVARAGPAPRLVLRQEAGDLGGEAFADAIGASLGFRGLQNRCRVADLDPILLTSWVDRASERAADWALVGWDGRCPDELLDAFASAQAAMVGAAVPDMAVTNRSAAEIREAEESSTALGIEHWVLAARHTVTGELGGFTEIELLPWQPWLGHQGDTGVMPVHRQLGLGRWLKAAMALRVRSDRPAVTQLETHTAQDNPPMRAINEAMGFHAAVVWQDRELALT